MTYHCPMHRCDGQMRKSTDRSGRWFCDECWFTLPGSFFVMESARAESFLLERVAKYRKKLVASRREEVVAAVAALRKTTLADDEPEIARILEPLKRLLEG